MNYLLSYRKDEVMVKAILELLKDFHLGKDMNLYIATKEQAIKAGMPNYLYSNLNIVYDNGDFTKYSKTIDQMRQAASDFRKGWTAAKRS